MVKYIVITYNECKYLITLYFVSFVIKHSFKYIIKKNKANIIVNIVNIVFIVNYIYNWIVNKIYITPNNNHIIVNNKDIKNIFI